MEIHCSPIPVSPFASAVHRALPVFLSVLGVLQRPEVGFGTFGGSGVLVGSIFGVFGRFDGVLERVGFSEVVGLLMEGRAGVFAS